MNTKATCTRKMLGAVMLLISGGAAQAGNLQLSDSWGANRASIEFAITSSSALQVTLWNTTLESATSTEEVLTGFYFNLPAQLNLKTVSMGASSSVLNCGVCPSFGPDLLSGWTLNTNTLGKELGGSYTVQASSFGLVNNSTSFGQSALTGSPLVTSQLVFTFQTNGAVYLTSIDSVGFLWSSPLDFQAGFIERAHAPEPASMALIGLILMVTAYAVQRQINRS